MRRREVITLLAGGVAAVWPLAARAQQSSKLIRLGVLGPLLNNPPAVAQYQAFRTQLEELGFREGRNVTIDYQGVDDPRGPFIVAAELTRAQPDRSSPSALKPHCRRSRARADSFRWL